MSFRDNDEYRLVLGVFNIYGFGAEWEAVGKTTVAMTESKRFLVNLNFADLPPLRLRIG